MQVKTLDNIIVNVPKRDYTNLSKLFYELGRDFTNNDPINIELDRISIELFLNFCDCIDNTDMKIQEVFLRDLKEIRLEVFTTNPKLEKFYYTQMESQEALILLIKIANYLMSSCLDDLINLKVIDVIYTARPDDFFKLDNLDQPNDIIMLKHKYMQFCDVSTFDDNKVDELILRLS